MTTLPLVPAISQFDGGPLAAQNCTATSGARLLLYATGIRTSGSRVRSMQSDQSGGTSIPDIMRGLAKGWGFKPQWASPNDSNNGKDPVPANRVADWITPTDLRKLLGQGFMVIVQGDYGDLPLKYREQATFRDDHAFTVDARRGTGIHEQAYIVDTIPKYGSGYKGRWIPWSALMAYTTGLSGSGRIYAAWARGLPDTSTEGEAMKLDKPQALSGTAVITAADGYYLWRVRDDTKTKVLAKGTKFDKSVLGRVRYHASKENPEGWPGLLVPYAGELHVLPEGQSGQLASFYPEWTTTEAYNAAIDDAAKACAAGGAQAVTALKR